MPMITYSGKFNEQIKFLLISHVDYNYDSDDVDDGQNIENGRVLIEVDIDGSDDTR